MPDAERGPERDRAWLDDGDRVEAVGSGRDWIIGGAGDDVPVGGARDNTSDGQECDGAVLDLADVGLDKADLAGGAIPEDFDPSQGEVVVLHDAAPPPELACEVGEHGACSPMTSLRPCCPGPVRSTGPPCAWGSAGCGSGAPATA